MISNGWIQLDTGLSTVARAGNNLTVSWVLKPVGTFTGPKNVYLKSEDASAAVSAWRDLGSWTVAAALPPPANRTPTAVSVAPVETRSQANQFRTVTAVYSDADGNADLRTTMVLVNTTTGGANALYAAYSSFSNKVYLRKADNTDWMPGVLLGAATVLDNGFGRLDASRTTVTRSGNTLTVNWVLAYKSSATGTLWVHLQALDQKAAGSGWKSLGRWVWEAAPRRRRSTAHPLRCRSLRWRPAVSRGSSAQ